MYSRPAAVALSCFKSLHTAAAAANSLVCRCVLLHGLFEVWGHGRDQEEAVKDATT